MIEIIVGVGLVVVGLILIAFLRRPIWKPPVKKVRVKEVLPSVVDLDPALKAYLADLDDRDLGLLVENPVTRKLERDPRRLTDARVLAALKLKARREAPKRRSTDKDN